MSQSPVPTWITEATAPLADNPELQIAAQQELLGLADGDDGGDLLERGFARANALSPGRRRTLVAVRIVLLALPLILLIGFGVRNSLVLRRVMNEISVGGGMAGSAVEERPFENSLNRSERLLVYGDTNAPTERLQWKALWESDPKNPVFYMEYLRHCDPLPADMLEVAERIDPGNGWFHLWKAGALAKTAVEKERGSRRKRPDPRLPPEERYRIDESERKISGWKVKDQDRLDEAVKLIHEAAAARAVQKLLLEDLQARP